MDDNKSKNRKRKFDERSFDEKEKENIEKELENETKKKKVNHKKKDTGNNSNNISSSAIPNKDEAVDEIKLKLESENKNNLVNNPFAGYNKSLHTDIVDKIEKIEGHLHPHPIESIDQPKIKMFYYINSNKLTVSDLKDGRRIFNNKTELSGYTSYQENFMEFRQLLFENLLLNEDFSENLKEKWTLESALFSTFCYDEEFIEPLIFKNKIKSVIIKHEDNKASQIVEMSDLITFIHPKIDYTLKWGKFHSKLTIFKFPTFLRVIIPSANLTSGDWYYWGQIIWFQDFPLKSSNKKYAPPSEFESYLDKVLDYTLPVNYKTKKWFTNLNFSISDYDFSDTVVNLIASSSGRFKNDDKNDFGVGRLKFLTQKYSAERNSLKHQNNTKLLVQCSSIGKSLKEKFLSDICEGFLCKNKTVDIIYPTIKYVNSFPIGPQLSGCLFLSQDTFSSNKGKFKKFEMLPQFENCKTIFHSKFIISCPDCGDSPISEETLSDNTIFYFGSHNLSIAAWGSLEKGDSQVSISNFELGIIFDPIKLRYEEKQKIFKSLLINLNSGYYSNEDAAFIADNY